VVNWLGGTAAVNSSPGVPMASYSIGNSLMLDSASSQYLSRTPGVAGNLRKWTYSTWVKRGKLSSNYPAFFGNAPNGTGDNMWAYFNTTDTIQWALNNSTVILETIPLYRDPSSWYHIVLVWDSDNATTAYKARIYVNGSEVTSFSVDNRSSLSGKDSSWNKAVVHYLFGSSNSLLDFDGYAAETSFVDGQVLAPSSFAQTDPTTGQWLPKAYTGTYGTNGFHLSFSSGVAPGADSSGNGNTWTVNGGIIAANNQMIDSPNNNFATWSPIHMGTNATLSNGSLNVSVTPTGGDG